MRALDRWITRYRARRRLRKEVALWYHPDYAMEALSASARVTHVDVQRSERILGTLVAEGALRPGDVRAPEPVSFHDLQRIHTPAWLERSTEPDVLARIFGLEPGHVPVDPLLAAQRRAAGGTLEAARAAAGGRARVAFNLGGGFHHAAPELGAGFCIYNDVAVAIATLREEGFDAPIAVVDLDYHQGDGTLLAFATDETVLTYSLHGSVWVRVEARADAGHLLPPDVDDPAYLAALEETLPERLAAHRPGLVFYLAGNDVLAGDRLGGFALSPAGVLERDRRVTAWARALGAPMVVTLSGGYSDRAWRASAAYLRWLLTGVARDDDEARGDLLAHYGRIRRTLDPAILQKEDDLGLTFEDVLGDLTGTAPERRLLGYYSVQGVELALERYGFFESIRALGFIDLLLEVEPADPARQVIRLFARRPGLAGPRVLLLELVLRLLDLPVPDEAETETREPLHMVSVEWLLLQDPTAPFSLERPPLPGQRHPGLGRAREVLALLVQVCRRLSLDGVLNRPGHYHVAFVGAKEMCFLDPVVQGRFDAMRKVLADWDLVEATEVVEAGRLRLVDGTTLRWDPAHFVLPVSERLVAWPKQARYREVARAETRRLLEAGLHVVREGRPGAAAATPSAPGPG
jgi:acetoin utilization deacetylase AcuC-like enzyme